MPTNNRFCLTGQTIVEVMVAVALTALAFVGLLSLGNLSIKSTGKARNENLAIAYSSQAADWLRNSRDQYGWDAIAAKFLADGGGELSVTYCLTSLPSTATDFLSLIQGPCTTNQVINDTAFTREMTISLANITNKSLKATITTTWPDNTNPKATIEVTLDKTQ